MESLPKELYIEVFSHLSHTDQLQVSQTCRIFAHLVKPLLFSMLNFDGNAQKTWYEPVWTQHHIGRKKSVKTVHLPSAVDEVINMGIAPYVKTLKFSPAFYVDDFWTNYRRHLQSEIDEREISYDDIPDDMSDGLDDDSQFGCVGFRRVHEEMVARPEREHCLIEENERLWQEGAAKQETDKDIITAALVKMLKAMPNLVRIEIGVWHVDMNHLGFPAEYIPDEVGEQFSLNSTIWSNLSYLATALHDANRHIKELHVPNLDPKLCIDSDATRHAFTGLTALEIYLETVKFLNIGPARKKTPLASLLKSTQPTLQKLKIVFTGNERGYSAPGEHTFDNLLCEAYTGADDKPRSIEFPSLKQLEFSQLMVHTPSLMQFLSHQPALETVSFDKIHLGSPGYEWSDIATSLPPSCTSWYVSGCRQGPVPCPPSPSPRMGYGEFMPYEEILSPSTGWKIKDPFCETDPDPKLWYNKQYGQFWLRPSHRARYMTKETKESLMEAAYERVDALGEERVGAQGELNRRRNQARKRAKVPDDSVPPENFFSLPSPFDKYAAIMASHTSALSYVPGPWIPNIDAEAFPSSRSEAQGTSEGI